MSTPDATSTGVHLQATAMQVDFDSKGSQTNLASNPTSAPRLKSFRKQLTERLTASGMIPTQPV